MKEHEETPLPIGELEHPRGNVKVLVEQGYKSSDDRKLSVTIPEQTALTFGELAWLVACFIHTETISRGKPNGRFLGGLKFIVFLADMMRHGLQNASEMHQLKR